jgi:phenylacetate-coenzyme A ligase PaaK-like adenylate-forming protein
MSATRAIVAAGKASHVSYAVSRTFRELDHATAVNATLAVHDIVDRLNALQPAILQGYPSVLSSLALEAAAGRLRIDPRMIVTIAEPLLPEMRSAMEEAWGSAVINAWGASEGAFASACGQGQGMHLGEDFTIYEFVDGDGAAVAPGVRAAKMYITNLYNYTQPLIRYELTDEATVLDAGPCPCGSAMRRIDDIGGRTDDLFTYGGVTVHPMVFRSPLGRERHIIEYQVRQTERGADVELRTDGSVDVDSLRVALEKGLADAGLRDPRIGVEVRREEFERQPTGKFKRFFPLT